MKKIIQGIVILFVIAVIRYAYTQSTPDQTQKETETMQVDMDNIDTSSNNNALVQQEKDM